MDMLAKKRRKKVTRTTKSEAGPGRSSSAALHASVSQAGSVGDEIRTLRKARQMTLHDLTVATGFSIGYLSQVERGHSSPSVDAMQKIAQALGISIGWFFHNEDSDDAEEREFVVRAKRRRTLKFDAGVTDDLLSPHLRGQLEMLLCRFPPGSSSGDTAYTHRGEEGGFVVAGQLKVCIGDKEFLLHPGDSFGFPSSTPHRYVNMGQDEAVVIFAITPPYF